MKSPPRDKGARAGVKNRGFTLVEVIISSVIILICTVGIMDVFIVGSCCEKRSEEITTSSFLAQQLLELSLQYSYDDLSDITEEQLPEPYNNYKYTIKTTPVDGSINLVKIIVRVSTPASKYRGLVEISALKLIQ